MLEALILAPGAVVAAAPFSFLAPPIAPGLIFVLMLCAAAGLVLMLPGSRETAFRKVGAAVMLAAGVVFAAFLAKAQAGMGAYFWIFSSIAVLAAVRVVTHPKPVYSALYFVLTVMASAGLFVLMWAEFMAAALVLIYAGAILVTYVFVIMLAAQATPAGDAPMHEQLADHDAISREPVIASAIAFVLLGLLLFVNFDRSTELRKGVASAPTTQPATAPVAAASRFVPVGSTQELGSYLFDKHLINLELAGLILTLAVVGAIVIARKRVIEPAHAAGPALVGSAAAVEDNPHRIPVVGTDNPRQKEYPQT